MVSPMDDKWFHSIKMKEKEHMLWKKGVELRFPSLVILFKSLLTSSFILDFPMIYWVSMLC